MIAISFPIEAFDETQSIIHTDGVGDNKEVFLTFRKDLIEVCQNLNIPPILRLPYDENVIERKRNVIDSLNKSAKEAFLKKYTITNGFDKFSEELVISGKIKLEDLMSALLSRTNIPHPPTEALYFIDDIEVPDDLIEKYLMLKMSV